jgi:zinc protease
VLDVTALHDQSGKEGTAELTAQALREGTADRTGIQLTLELEKLGTSLETGADWDSTVASMTVLKDRLPQAFEIFAEVLLAPAFRTEDVERLKGERLAERMQLLDEPRGLADESFSRFLYSADSRYAAPMGGSTRSVSAITRDDVETFYRRNYAPSATTVILVGDITPEAGLSLVQSKLGSWSASRSVENSVADKAQRSEQASELVAKPDAAQSEVRIGHIGVPRTNPDYFRIAVMNAVLGGLFSSRINLNLREANGYTYGASSYYDWRRQSGPFVISTAVQSEVTGAAITETLKEITRMREDEISQDELTLATSYLEGVFPIRYETTAAIASALTNMIVFDLPHDYFNTYRDNIAKVTTRDVLEAAKAYVNPELLQVLVVGNPDLVQTQMAELAIGKLSVREATEL